MTHQKQTYISLLLIALSAALYSVPFIYAIAWPLLFFCLAPLFYVIADRYYTKQPMPSFGAGYLWGGIATIFHLSSVFYSMTHSGPSNTLAMLLRALPLVPIMAYATLYAALWFWIVALSNKYIPAKNIVDLLIRWIVATALYFYIVSNCYMFVFGRIEGYSLLNPLLPLATKSFLIYPLMHCGEFVGLIALVTLNASIGMMLYYILHKKYGACILPAAIVSTIIILWTASALSIQKQIPDNSKQAQSLLGEIVHCPSFFRQRTNNTLDVVENISTLLKAAAAKYPQAHTFITQEAATRVSSFPYTKVLSEPFNQDFIGRPIQLLLGAFRWDRELYHNSLYCFYNGAITNCHDKRHAMAFEERMPWIINWPVLKDAFFGTFTPINPCKLPRKPFVLNNGVTILPYICSELFFNSHPDEEPDILKQKLPILAACNDSWSKLPYTHELMALHVKYKAIYWQRIIIYDAFNKGLLITPDGTIYQLARYSRLDDISLRA
jgi:hypothetical protein